MNKVVFRSKDASELTQALMRNDKMEACSNCNHFVGAIALYGFNGDWEKKRKH